MLNKHSTVSLAIIAFAIFLAEAIFFVYWNGNKSKETNEKITSITVTVDSEGIPLTDYGDSIGKQRNPVDISQQGFKYWNQYQKGDKEAKKKFINVADWLVENSTIYMENTENEYATLEYTFNWKPYKMSAPWRSSLAQAQAIQVLARAYDITKKHSYKRISKLLLNSFYIDIQEGGVTIKDKNGWWYEEYADENGANPKILNGMMYALLGIYEYYERTGSLDNKALFLFDMGIAELKKELHNYDSGEWTYYDKFKKPASPYYHNIHVNLLREIYSITMDPIFEQYHHKWKSYSDNSYYEMFQRK